MYPYGPSKKLLSEARVGSIYVSTAGIGYFTTLFTQSFNPTKLLGLISVLAAMAIALNEIVRRAELHYGRWRSD